MPNLVSRLRCLALASLGVVLAGCGRGADLVCGDHTKQQGSACIGFTTATTSAGAGGGADAFATLPPCIPAAMDGALDLEDGCVKGACAGSTFDEINAALGEIGHCMSDGSSDGQVYCSWEFDGISTFFPEEGTTGEPEPGMAANGLFITSPLVGSTKKAGAAIGTSLRCFLDELGPPESATLNKNAAGDYVVSELIWNGYQTIVDDGFLDIEPPTGVATQIAIFGPISK